MSVEGNSLTAYTTALIETKLGPLLSGDGCISLKLYPVQWPVADDSWQNGWWSEFCTDPVRTRR